MYRFFLFFKGYFLIVVNGFGTERFINLCKLKQIYLWDIKVVHNNTYRMKISMADYEILSELVNKTGVKVDILEKYGLPFCFLGKKNRTYYLIFLMIALILVFISNFFVWKIDVIGNYTITDEQIRDFLMRHEVAEGDFKQTIPYTVLEEELRKEFDLIKWSSVSLDGNTLIVHIEENTLQKEDFNEHPEGVYSDIISETDGIIKSILVRNGVALVKAGDTVTKGQILVTGSVPIYDDALQIKQYHYYDADADIFIETNVNYEENLSEIYYEKEYTGRKKRVSYIKIKNKDIHLPFHSKFAYYDTYASANQLKLFNRLDLPIYYGVYEAREYYRVEKRYSKKQAVKIFNDNLSIYYKTLSEKGVQILEKNVKIEHKANEWVVKGTFVVSIHNSKKEYRELQVENNTQ